MQSISTGSVVEVTCISSYQAQTVLNVFHYFNSGGDITEANGDGELQGLLTRFNTLVWNASVNGMMTQLVSGFTTNLLKAQVVNPTRQYYVEKIVTDVGAVSGSGIPSDTNMSISLRTAGTRRGQTGNKKITGLPLSTVDGNRFSTGAQDAMGLTADLFPVVLNNNAATPQWTPIVWSPRSPTARRQMIAQNPQQEVRVLRRRQYGKGI